MNAFFVQFYLNEMFIYLFLAAACLVLMLLLLVLYQRQVKRNRLLSPGASRRAQRLPQAVPAYQEEAAELKPAVSRIEQVPNHFLIWPLLGSGLTALGVVFVRFPALLPLVLVLLGLMLGYVLYVVLGFFKPAPQLQIFPGHPVPGMPCQLEWRFPRQQDRIARIKLVMRGMEKIHVSGMFQHEKPLTNLFHEEVLYEARRPHPVGQGIIDLDLPEFIPMSLKTKHQEIVWEIHVEWATSYWPDLQKNYTLQVAPGPLPLK